MINPADVFADPIYLVIFTCVSRLGIFGVFSG